MKTVLTALIVAGLFILALAIIPPKNEFTNPASALNPPFDHTNCQYPDRWSNPADGCDNSDPAVPECIKSFSTQEMEKACIEAYIARNAEPTQSEPVPTTQASEQIIYSCGGK